MQEAHRRIIRQKANVAFRSSRIKAVPSGTVRRDQRLNRSAPASRNGRAIPVRNLTAGSRGRNGQVSGTGGGEIFTGASGVSKVADLIKRQKSFLLVW